jgi:ABC-2 type transport system permease protein
MNATIPTTPTPTPTPAVAGIPATAARGGTFGWLLRREVWESRGVWIAPAICAAIIVLLLTVVGIQVGGVRVGVFDPEVVDKLRGAAPEQVARVGAAFLFALALPFFVTLAFTQFFYAVDALYSDRRDRSVLFWKSLPVSDAQTVFSKVVIACVVIPLVAGLAAVATQAVVWLLLAVKFAGSDLPVADVLVPIRTWLPAAGLTLYATVATMLWSVPLVGWLLAVSALAPRSPFLFATLPPVAVMIAERLAFGTDFVAEIVRDRFVGLFTGTLTALEGNSVFVKVDDGEVAASSLAALARPLALLASPSLWIGLAVGALLIAVAIWARRYRDETA